MFITILIRWKCFPVLDVALASQWTMFTVPVALFTGLVCTCSKCGWSEKLQRDVKVDADCLLLLRNNFSKWHPVTEVGLFWSFSAFFMSRLLAVGKSSRLNFILNFVFDTDLLPELQSFWTSWNWIAIIVPAVASPSLFPFLSTW